MRDLRSRDAETAAALAASDGSPEWGDGPSGDELALDAAERRRCPLRPLPPELAELFPEPGDDEEVLF